MTHADAEELERLDVELVEAMRAGDRVRMDDIDARRAKLLPPPAPKARPVPPPDGKTWRDIGGGWQELGSPRDPALSRRIRGIASSRAANSHNYIVAPSGLECELPIPLRCDHALVGRGVGIVDLLRRNSDYVYFEAALYDDLAGTMAWEKVVGGRYPSVSFGWDGRPKMKAAAKVDGTTVYETWRGGEISLVVEGANPDCRCEPLRDDGADWKSCVAAPLLSLGRTRYGLPGYKGVWRSDETYEAGCFVTDHGSLWCATVQVKGARPGADNALWKLAVKKGEAHLAQKERRHA